MTDADAIADLRRATEAAEAVVAGGEPAGDTAPEADFHNQIFDTSDGADLRQVAREWSDRKAAAAEYRYTDFGSYTKTFGLATTCAGSSSPASSCTNSPSSSVSIGLREAFHTFRVGLAIDLP
jgi:hypothetical protein